MVVRRSGRFDESESARTYEGRVLDRTHKVFDSSCGIFNGAKEIRAEVAVGRLTGQTDRLETSRQE